ncbi:MAG: response regulator transcription factor [Bacteroidia bacterium]|nr:response regulator transcription factor [Bacteroidia bacterium]
MKTKNQYKILVVDDEKDIQEFIEYNLKKEGYEVFLANNGSEAIEEAKKIKPDLILMDVMMPLMDGIQACQQIKTNPLLSKIFIVFLTARAEEYSELAGFDAGADDYIAKPIKPKLLLTRIAAILRRKETQVLESTASENIQLQVKGLIIDRDTFMVYKGAEKIQLARKEFELLYLLASKPGKVFKRDSILEKVWGDEVIVGDRTIDVHIRKIREKIGEDLVGTVKGVGYKFED